CTGPARPTSHSRDEHEQPGPEQPHHDTPSQPYGSVGRYGSNRQKSYPSGQLRRHGRTVDEHRPKRRPDSAHSTSVATLVAVALTSASTSAQPAQPAVFSGQSHGPVRTGCVTAVAYGANGTATDLKRCAPVVVSVTVTRYTPADAYWWLTFAASAGPGDTAPSPQ